MLREFFTNRWIIGGFLCLLIFAVFCHLWLRQETAKLQKQEAENAEIRQQWEQVQNANTNSSIRQTDTAQHSAVKPEAAMPETLGNIDTLSETVPHSDDTEKTVSGVTLESEDAEVPVSPHGFGPYPKLPEGWSAKTWNTKSADLELIRRVLIKLWHQGEARTKGGVMKNGLVYPIIPGTLYVEWDAYTGPFGKSVRYISRYTGHPADHPRLEAISEAKERRGARPISLTKEDIPSDIKLVPYSEGINPYTFLDLPRR